MQKAASCLVPGGLFAALIEEQAGTDAFCTLSFDCDFPRDIEVLPEVLTMLQCYDVVASFACIGQWVRRFPDAHSALVASGHELVNHTETHPNLYHPDYDYARSDDLNRERFNQIGTSRRREEIEQCHQTFVELLDYEPRGFRSPHFGALHVDDVYPILADLGYRFSSSKLAAAPPSWGRPFYTAAGVWEFPLSPCPHHPFGVFDSWHSLSKRGAAHRGTGVLSGLFAELCAPILAEGGYANIYFDPCDALSSGELERILVEIGDSGLEMRTYGELADELQSQAVAGADR